MSARGGYLRGPWWRYQSDEEDKARRCYVAAWGTIVKMPKETFKDVRKIQFVIKTGRGAGRNEKYLVCVAFGETLAAVVMRAMEKGDTVLVCGTWVENLKSKTKKGIKTTYECRVDMVIPQGLVNFLLDLYSTPEIQRAVMERQNEEADPWESD